MLWFAITTLFPYKLAKLKRIKTPNLEVFDSVFLQIHWSVGDRADLIWRMWLGRLPYMTKNK